MTVKKLSQNEIEPFIELIGIFEDVFEMKDFSVPQRSYLERLLENPDFFVFVATKDHHVVGGLTAYTLHQYYSSRPLAYIYDLAVKREFQRQGIGRKLITEINRYCAANGYEEVFVQADRIDQYALDFYRSTKPTNEEDVVHFSYRYS